MDPQIFHVAVVELEDFRGAFLLEKVFVDYLWVQEPWLEESGSEEHWLWIPGLPKSCSEEPWVVQN